MVTSSTLPLPLMSCMTIDNRIGAALSSGAVVVNEARLPAASRTPAALAAMATVKDPTVVSAAPAPSVMVSVAVVVTTAAEASVPPEGTAVRVHGVTPAV